MPRTSRAVVERNTRLVLAFLAHVTAGCGWTGVSYRDLCSAVQLTESQVRRALRQLNAHGLIEMTARSAEDGGTLSNAYRVTGQGRRRLVTDAPLMTTMGAAAPNDGCGAAEARLEGECA